MPNGPISREISRKDTGDAVTIGLVLGAVVATFVLFGPVLLKSEQKSMDVVATQPTDSPIKELSNSKMRFQSFFMLITVQPPFFASS